MREPKYPGLFVGIHLFLLLPALYVFLGVFSVIADLIFLRNQRMPELSAEAVLIILGAMAVVAYVTFMFALRGRNWEQAQWAESNNRRIEDVRWQMKGGFLKGFLIGLLVTFVLHAVLIAIAFSALAPAFEGARFTFRAIMIGGPIVFYTIIPVVTGIAGTSLRKAGIPKRTPP